MMEFGVPHQAQKITFPTSPVEHPRNIHPGCRPSDAMDRILLERLGIGWKDSVSEANEKRMKDAILRGTRTARSQKTIAEVPM
jgi:hypothetical protein